MTDASISVSRLRLYQWTAQCPFVRNAHRLLFLKVNCLSGSNVKYYPSVKFGGLRKRSDFGIFGGIYVYCFS